MQRWKLTLEYDGTNFSGWQSQADGKGIQDVVERAIAAIEGQARRTHAAGRTDRGVHATGQVIHVDLEKSWDGFRLCEALNAWLRFSGPVAIVLAEPVPDTFHARFSAQARCYVYRMVERRTPLTLNLGRVWRVPHHHDVGAMQEAAHFLIGTHDFTTFRHSDCQAKSPIKTLSQLSLTRVQGVFGDEIQAFVQAKSFLHRQVRSMMGTLSEVGRGRWQPADVKAALEARDRTKCGPVAPSDGLYLTDVYY
ncbi:tRNA pseudouridine(38-40) synthase TruA [Candidatus Phycosocius spiralis]|uniref:tRNA pseudouridine synthase A n=1 Tax=Candidatus Phycosocius spiralis TaxID=2815099 RepID=A0ABQ4PUK5_9PROT|nr:tRNA pseudouridine(38-40) synthase TruA [Candidatus Phycosocius spiralis]GIU66670.1 tRNA pseudouridine synthase A [Candidatus Phycosocius spiralis]